MRCSSSVIIQKSDHTSARRLDSAIPGSGESGNLSVLDDSDVCHMAPDALQHVRVVINYDDNVKWRLTLLSYGVNRQ